jgi:hypothetical protein
MTKTYSIRVPWPGGVDKTTLFTAALLAENPSKDRFGQNP